MDQNYSERNVTGKTRIRIRGDKSALHGPLFAINWFDTRVARIYHLYNTIVASRVFKVGGKVLFKGKCQATIYGNPELARKFLLIVNYPSADRFLDLASDKLFQLCSVLRIAAVERFSFVLHQRHHGDQLLTDKVPNWDKTGSYAVVHLSPPPSQSATLPEETGSPNLAATVGALAKQHNIELFFAGSAAGRLSTVGQDDKESALRAITEHTFVFSARTDAILADFLVSSDFQDAIGTRNHLSSLKGASVFAAILKRLL